MIWIQLLLVISREKKFNFMLCSSNTNQPSDSQREMWLGRDYREGRRPDEGSNHFSKSGAKLLWDQFNVASVLRKLTHPRMAKAGSSWRSNGKSRRKRVLKRAVIVSEEKEEKKELFSIWFRLYSKMSVTEMCINCIYTHTYDFWKGVNVKIITK